MKSKKFPDITVFLLAILLLFAPQVNKAQAESYGVSEVTFTGAERIDVEAMRLNVVAVPGQVTSEVVNRDIRTLYKTGFFDEVEARFIRQPEGRILEYRVVEKPVVRKVFVKGNDEVDEDDLSEVLKFDNRRFVDKLAITQVARKAQAYYQQQGYFDVAIEHSVVPVGNNQVDVTYTVEEGERYTIASIEFYGLDQIDEDDLRDTMLTKRYKWYSSWLFGTGRPNKEMLKNDKAILGQYLLDNGYVDGSVSEASVDTLEDGEVRVSFQITEGEQYEFGQVEWAGDSLEGVEDVLDGIKSESGEVFNATSLREDSFTISEKYSDYGYAFANVVPDTSINRDTSSVDVTYRVSKGKLVKVNQIRVGGNTKTYDNVIRREIRVQEQQTYSGSKVRRSQQLLERTGYFEEVDITNEPVAGVDDEIDLNVRVREGSTGTFSIGAGFSSTDGALFNTRLSENNFLGTGRNVNANIDIGARRDSIILSVIDPRLNDSNWTLGVQGSLTDRQFNDFDRSLKSGGVFAGYPLEEVFGDWAQDITFRTGYEYNSIDIEDIEPGAAQIVQDSAGNTTSSSITPALIRNTINNPLNPTNGSRQRIEVEYAGLGGNQDFYLLEASNQLFYPLADTSIGEFVFSWRFRLGYGESNGDEDRFPLFRRFFPGGINSVRGFKERTLGPEDENGREFGGSKQVVNNLELIFPLIEQAGIKGVVFFDTGEAFDDDQSVDFGSLRKSYGYGIRWLSPLGPIRVEIGHPLDPQADEDSLVTHFSFGAPL